MKNLIIHCKDFELTDAIKLYAEEKMSVLFKFLNFSEDEVRFNLRLGKTSKHHSNGKIFYAELSISAPHKNYEATIESDDTYVAIDLLRDEMAENIRAYKDKKLTVSRHEAQKFKEELHQVE